MKNATLWIAFVLLGLGSQAQQLKVNQVNFVLIQEEEETLMVWNTKREVNTSHFLVERSVDGTCFEAVARVNASGNSVFPREYTLTGIQDSNMNYRYRIGLVNMEGVVNYSTIQYAEKPAQKAVPEQIHRSILASY